MKRSILQITAVEFTYKQFVHPLSLSLIANGWKVSCAFNRSSDSAFQIKLKKDNISFLSLEFYRSTKLFLLLRSFINLYRIISNDSSSIIHVHTPLLSYMARICFLVPFVRRKRRLVYTVHGFYFQPGQYTLSNLIHFILEFLLLPVCDTVFFVSKSDYHLSSRYLSFLRIPSFLSGNGVDLGLFKEYGNSSPSHLSTSNQKNDRPFTIGFVGRFVREKGLLELLGAFKIFKSLYPCSHLLLIGARLKSDYDQSVDSRLQSILAEFKSSVTTTGMIEDKHTLVNLYNQMDIFCLPSYREGLPTSLIEAMACGVAPVATDIRGCNELIRHEQNGLLVTPRSIEELVSAFIRLATNPSLVNRYGLKSKEIAKTSHDLVNSLAIQVSAITHLCD